MPASSSSAGLRIFRVHGAAYSLRYTAENSPTGRPITAESDVTSSVPITRGITPKCFVANCGSHFRDVKNSANETCWKKKADSGISTTMMAAVVKTDSSAQPSSTYRMATSDAVRNVKRRRKSDGALGCEDCVTPVFVAGML